MPRGLRRRSAVGSVPAASLVNAEGRESQATSTWTATDIGSAHASASSTPAAALSEQERAFRNRYLRSLVSDLSSLWLAPVAFYLAKVRGPEPRLPWLDEAEFSQCAQPTALTAGTLPRVAKSLFRPRFARVSPQSWELLSSEGRSTVLAFVYSVMGLVSVVVAAYGMFILRVRWRDAPEAGGLAFRFLLLHMLGVRLRFLTGPPPQSATGSYKAAATPTRIAAPGLRDGSHGNSLQHSLTQRTLLCVCSAGSLGPQ